VADEVLGFAENGFSVYRRPDGTYYTYDPLLGSQLDCIAPGQITPPRTTGYDGFSFGTFVPTACPPIVRSSDPQLGFDYINTRTAILNYLPDTPFGSATTQRIVDAANAGPGLLPLLEAQTPETLGALKAQLDNEAARQTAAFVAATGGDTLGKSRYRDRADGSFDVLGAVKTLSSFVANPVGTYVQLALRGVADQLAPTTVKLARDPYEAFNSYQASRFYQAQNQAFYDASLAASRERLMTFASGGFNPYGDFSLNFGGYDSGGSVGDAAVFGGTGGPPIAMTGGGVLDTVLSAIPTLIRGAVQLAPTGLLGGSLQRAFTPQSPSGGVSPGTMAAPAAGTGGMMTTPLNQALQYALMAYAQAQGGMSANVGGPNGMTVNMGGMVAYDENSPTQNVMWPSNGCTPCAPRTRYVDITSAPGLVNAGCRGVYGVSQAVLQLPDGSRQLYMKVGKIIAPSQKALQRAARKLAKQAHCTVSTGGGRRRARRTYRRRPR